MISITLSIVVNLLTLAVVTGFQNEIRRKVTGFSAPLFIQHQNNKDFYEADPIRSSKKVEDVVSNINGILKMEKVAYKPGMLQSQDGIINGKNYEKEVIGLVFKGVEKNYNWKFIQEHLTKGRLPNFNTNEPSDEIIISEKISKMLHLKLNDEVSGFFVKDQPLSRKFKIIGIYNTGFEDYDSKLVICDIRVNQKLNDWGVSSQLNIGDSLWNKNLLVRLDVHGNENSLVYDWGNGKNTYRGQLLPLETKDTMLHAKIFHLNPNTQEFEFQSESHIRIKYLGLQKTFGKGSEITKYSLNASGSKYKVIIQTDAYSDKVFEITSTSDNGTSNQFISGYEIHIKDWNQLKEIESQIKDELEMVPTEHKELVKVVSIIDLEQDLFTWLGFLDVNVAIIVILMLIIGIINMGSALLVLIVIRTNFIGLFKALGAQNKTIRRIFLYQASYLIGKGLLIGNIIGLGLYFLQKNYKIITLNPEVYYLDSVPLELTFTHFIALNIGSFAVCILALLIPSSVITRINPVRAITFN